MTKRCPVRMRRVREEITKQCGVFEIPSVPVHEMYYEDQCVLEAGHEEDYHEAEDGMHWPLGSGHTGRGAI